MKKIITALASVLVFSAAPALTQAAPAKGVPAAAVDPAVAAAVKDMLVSMKYREVMAASLHQLQQTMPAMIRSTMARRIESDAHLSEVQKKAALQRAEQEIPHAITQMTDVLSDPALLDELMVEIVPLYANNFTLAEIREIGAFYRSSTGQKVLVTLPKLMSDSMVISDKVISPRVERLLQQYVEPAIKP